MDVVVVESPTKAKTINKYLGEGFKVLSSYGHVRDLPEKDGSVRPDEDFAITYEPLADRRPRLREIAQALKGADRLWLATDPDREGEAISWHLVAALTDLKALRDVDVKRVVFHEITRAAVEEAMHHPRALDDHLINAYQARRALDYLVGFTLSPVLWRKLQGSRSAGRVQSVALRLICEREDEIEAFRPQEYWTVEADFRTERNEPFTARLTRLEGRKLERFDLGDEAAAKRAVEAVQVRQFRVDSVERKQAQRHPAPPFATSTLQQEAARKLGFSASRTMQVAQRLFEGIELGGETTGLITYMRTDSVQLSGEAIGGARRLIARRYGERYVPEAPRQYRTRTKNAQEAHEAIRPTDMFRTPDGVGRFLDGDQRRLYELIWQRTVASQMASAVLDRTTVDVGSPDGQVTLRATGTIVVFDGFFKVYQEGRDDPDTSAKAQRTEAAEEQDDAERRLPEIAQGERAERGEVRPEQHFTQPPARYTEASLVKKLEELGIGRPSTYASIISVLQDRGYVQLESKRFVPEDRGRLVSAFLTSFFDRWVQPGFTAELEDRLDQIAGGDLEWKQVLRDFWGPFAAIVDEVKERRVADVIDALNLRLADHLFPPRPDGGDPRACPLCGDGTLSLKLGRYGAFVGCSNYPECRFTRPLGTKPGDEEEGGASKDRLLGADENGFEIWLKHGRFGAYVERADEAERKRASLPPGTKGEDVGLDRALALLALPREVCRHRETGKPVLAGINRFGPYLQHDGKFVRLPPDEDVLTVGENRALTLLAANEDRRRPGPKVLREVGAHPEDGQPIQLFEGRFGPYLKHGRVNASLPKTVAPDSVDVGQAVALLAERAAKAGNGKVGPGKRQSAATAKGNGAAKAARGANAKAKVKAAGASSRGGKRATDKAEGSKPS